MNKVSPDQPGEQTWEVCSLDGREGFLKVTQAQWFEVFREGSFRGSKFRWMQPVGQPDKRVTFLENQSEASIVTKLS